MGIRRPHESDVDALVALYRACDELDEVDERSDREDVLWRWRTPEFERSVDAWVAEDGGRVAAYGWVFEGLAEVRVHPASRGEGLGRRLLDLVEGRAAEQGSRDGLLRQNVTSLNPSARALLEANGYVYSHHYTRLEISLEERPEVPEPSSGVEIRPYEVGSDDAPVHEAFNRAWSQYEGERWEPESLERWLENVAAETFDPATWHLAIEDDRIVAFCLCEQYGDLGWVQYLGTLPEQRGRGLGRLLLLHAFAAYYDRGLTRIELTVSSSNVPAARALYDRVGMQEVLRYDNLKKPIGALRGSSRGAIGER
jgi:mycothiol synthase